MKFKKYDDGSVVFNEDAMDVLDLLIDKNIKVDCIITDPPYKITARGNGGNSGGMFQKKEVNNGKVFDKNDLEIEDWLPKLWNILNEQSHCYIMTNNKNITHYLKVINEMYFNDDKKQKFHFIKNLIWVKDNKIMGQTYMSQFEYVIMLRKGAHKKINNCGTADVLQFPNKKLKDENNKTIHDTEKPVEMMELLIENSTDIGDIVCDPFVGIGGVALGAMNTGRKFYVCEIDNRYYDFTIERLDINIKEG